MKRLALCSLLLLVRAYAADTALVQQGQKLFSSTCGFCHGPDASGGAEGPNLMHSSVVRHDKDGNLISVVVREGRPNKGMPSFTLTDQQIAGIVAFLHARVVESDRRSPARPKGYALSLLLTGDAKAGQQYFQQHCTSCHSSSGDLAGVAKKYEPADLQARFLYPPDVPKTVDVTDASGHQFTGTLLHEDWFAVSLRDKAGDFHSWDLDKVKATVHDPDAGHLKLLGEYSDADVHNIFAYLETLK